MDNNIKLMLRKIIPEKIRDHKFKDLLFTTEMLDIYYVIDGKTSLVELSRLLSIDLVRLIEQVKKMRKMGIVKVGKANSRRPL